MWTPESLAACKSPTDSVKKSGEHEHEDVDMRGVWSSRPGDTSNLHRMESLLQKPPRETRGGEGGRGRGNEGERNRRAARPIIIVIKAD